MAKLEDTLSRIFGGTDNILNNRMLIVLILIFIAVFTDLLDDFLDNDNAWIWIILVILLLFNFDDSLC